MLVMQKYGFSFCMCHVLCAVRTVPSLVDKQDPTNARATRNGDGGGILVCAALFLIRLNLACMHMLSCLSKILLLRSYYYYFFLQTSR